VTDLLYVENLRVSQGKIHLGDPRWYVVNAAQQVVKGPFEKTGKAQDALEEIRRKAYAEAREEKDDD